MRVLASSRSRPPARGFGLGAVLFGRRGSAAQAKLRRRQFDDQGRSGLPAPLLASLERSKKAVEEQVGREVPFDLHEWPFFVTISDGEGTGNVAVGIWKPGDSEFQPRITAAAVPPEWLSRWHEWGLRVTAIQEIEAVGPVLALSTWPELLTDCTWLHFIDNESAKFSLIKGSSKAVYTNEIVHATWDLCRARRVYPWWERVASADNPVDKASRGDLRDLSNQRWRAVALALPAIWARDFNLG